MPTLMYHPYFTPQLNWFFASYTESTESFNGTVNGEEKACIELRNPDSVQKALREGWLKAPIEEKQEVEPEVVDTPKPAPKKRGRKRKSK